MKRLTLLSTLVAVALGGACADAPVTDPITNTPHETVEFGLSAAKSCDDLDGYIKQTLKAEFDKRVDGLAENGYLDFHSGWGGGPEVSAGFAEDTALGGSGDSSPATTPPTKGPDHSTTNNQVDGVDEDDLVKTDGKYLYVVSDGFLRILKTLPANKTELVGKTAVHHSSRSMFLRGDRVVVFSQRWNYINQGWEGGGGVAVMPEPAPTEPVPDEAPAAEEPMDAEDAPSPGASKPGAPDAETDFTEGLRGQLTQMTVIDVSDRTNPYTLRKDAFEGDLTSARMIGGDVHVVMRGQLHLDTNEMETIFSKFFFAHVAVDTAVPVAISTSSATSTSSSASREPTPMPTVDCDPDAFEENGEEICEEMRNQGQEERPTDFITIACSDEEWENGECRDESWDKEPEEPEAFTPEDITNLKAEFATYIDGIKLNELLPRRVTSVGNELTNQKLTKCSGYFKPAFLQGTSLVTVLTTNLDSDDQSMSAVTTLGNVSTVYANQDNLYAVAYVHDYWFWADVSDKNSTEFSTVHKFQLGSKGAAYKASGRVPGRVLNQFSLDEHNAHLRVATTSRNWQSDGISTSGVYVLGTKGKKLKLVGQVEGLAKNEDIYSARFMGDRGYVVTFERIDPLFTLDLSDPTQPKVAGELKIPGFSTYIHPLGKNHLLTIGQDTFDNGDWVSIEGVQVQIFDVSDMSKPMLKHKYTHSGSSEALYNHKAFNYFAEHGLLAIPMQEHGGWDVGPIEPWLDDDEMDSDSEDDIKPSQPQSGTLVLSVDADAGLAQAGFITEESLGNNSYWSNNRRTMMIEDHMYTVNRHGVLVNEASTLNEVAAIQFENQADQTDGPVLIGMADEPSAEE